jgi:histone deacetylase 6
MNLNIPWTKGGVGNIEYAAAFSELILPLMIEFEPDLVLISSGFDAAKGDLLGDCELTPEMYYCMTKSILLGLGEDVPIVIALEGGYNVDVNCDCMEAVSLALLDEPWEKINENCKQNDNNQCGNQKLPQDCSSRKNPGYKGERLAVSRKILSQFWDNITINDKQKGFGAQSTAIKSINQSMVAIQNSTFWRGKEVHLSQVNIQNRLNKKKPVNDFASLDNVSDALKRMVLEK